MWSCWDALDSGPTVPSSTGSSVFYWQRWWQLTEVVIVAGNESRTVRSRSKVIESDLCPVGNGSLLIRMIIVVGGGVSLH